MKVVVAILGVAALLVVFTYLSISPNEVSCEVCMEFNGRTECRKASGKNREEAEFAAASTACGLISGGVTDGMGCRNAAPKSVTCESR
jgi:hypothetical protein